VDDGYRVRIPLPGIAPENVTVDVTGRSIHVRAIERDGDTEVTRHEEVLTLPASVDAEKDDAVKPRIEIETTEERKQLPSAA
jgi:HSP20 family molecular chaperone IbpA